MLRTWNLPINALNDIVSVWLAAKTRVTPPILESLGCHVARTVGSRDKPTYELLVPASRVDLFDLGGVAASVICLLKNENTAEAYLGADAERGGEAMRTATFSLLPPRLDWPLAVFPPNERMFLVVLAYWGMSFALGEGSNEPLYRDSFRDMLFYLNGEFRKAVGQKCRIKLFDMQATGPDQQRDPMVEARWSSDTEFSVAFGPNGKTLPDATTRPPPNGLLLIQGSTRDVVMGVAHALVRSMRLYRAAVYALGTRQAVTALEVIDLSIKPGPATRQVPTRLNPHAIERWLGVRLHPFKLQNVLNGLGYRAETGLKTLFYVELEVPAHRFDVRDEVDVIGDIACALGYDAHRPDSLQHARAVSAMPLTISYGKEAEIEIRSMDVRQTLVGLGFQEVVTSLIVQDTDDGDPLVADDALSRSRLVRLETTGAWTNPVLRRHLYTQILEHLGQRLEEAARQDKPDRQDRPEGTSETARHQALFEVGDVYEEDAAAARDACIQCRRYLGGVIADNIESHPRFYSSRYETLFDEAKAIVIAILSESFGQSRERLEFSPIKSPLFVPFRAAAIRSSSGRLLGRLGEISAEVLSAHQISWPTTLFEIDITDLL